MKVSQVTCNGAPSLPTGFTNLALPAYFRQHKFIHSLNVEKQSALHKFLNVDEESGADLPNRFAPFAAASAKASNEVSEQCKADTDTTAGPRRRLQNA